MSAQADWNPGDPFKMHYPQLPDLGPTGMDVLASLAFQGIGPGSPDVKYLADDFQCTQTGPITDVHIWGSWLQDQMPPVPMHGTFILAIYSDIPAGTIAPWSMPGELLWRQQFKPGEYSARLYDNASEQFFDPNIHQIIGTDTQVWQYNFYIDEALALTQQAGNIYWLAVANVDPNNDGIINTQDLLEAQEGINRFGWKTSIDHFNDDAAFIDVGPVMGMPVDLIPLPETIPGASQWEELRNPFTGQSLDLAFVITPEPASLALLILGSAVLLRRYD
ncbi:MAG: hypothetical protein IT445_01600 [Phycisphaeraceae bacterium]|nr:hypothetical protein [Phycisphaeraceae bacterium]